MKPILLKMTAFGPYKAEEVVDFTQLLDNRLFVVSGPTGAGKTTIFDAICFALYGLSSGVDRDNVRMLRSDFAEDDVHTAVEFLFEINARTYRVLRQLGHQKEGRKSITGEKYELFEVNVDGSEKAIVERQKVTDINQKLEQLIGLSYNQFSQIVMLPQGEFRKLLTSQSENKEAILRKIFKTDRYGQMTKIVEAKKQAAEQDAYTAQKMRDTYIDQLNSLLPLRESTLFMHLQNRGNVYQIQEGLKEERAYYEMQTDRLANEYEVAKKQFETINTELVNARLSNERLDQFAKLQDMLTLMEANVEANDAKRTRYEAAMRAATLHYLDEQCISLKKELDRINDTLLQTKQTKAQLTSTFEQIKEQFENEKNKEELRLQAQANVTKLEALMPVYTQLKQVMTSVEEAKNEHTHTLQKLTLKQNHYAQLAEQIAVLVSDLEKLEISAEQLQETVMALNEVRQQVTLISKWKKELQTFTVTEHAYEQVLLKYENARANFKAEEAKWLSNQAYQLAQTLTPGVACPVCGSLEHQQLATSHETGMDEGAFKNLKAHYEQVENEKSTAEVSYNVASKLVKQTEEELSLANVLLDDASAYEIKLVELEKAYQLQKEQIEQSKQLKEKLEGLNRSLHAVEEESKQLEATVKVAEQKVIEQMSKYEQMKVSLHPTIETVEALNQAITDAKNEAVKLQFAWDEANKAYQQIQIDLSKWQQKEQSELEQFEQTSIKLTESKQQFVQKLKDAAFENYTQYANAKLSDEEISTLKEQYLEFVSNLHTTRTKVMEEKQALVNVTYVDLNALNLAVLKKKQEEELAFEHYKSSLKFEEVCEQYDQKLGEVAEEIVALEKVTHQIIDLYNLLKGQNSKKISFERFIQISYLEQITEAANVRLTNLSNGQYSLICSDRQESHGRQSGLSLDVFDSYTGQVRDVKTLSGGEKFNASLSLALGMADVIQNFQGSVRIDTMFIDEGFGSLDEESLMRAIDTLFELQNTGRMIGVISHVNELKDAFPATLQVEKSKEGFSTTKFVLK